MKEKGTTQTANLVTQCVSVMIVIPVMIILVIVVILVLALTGNIKLPRINLNPGQLNSTEYGTACTSTDGKAGLHGTDGLCYTCTKDSSTPFTNPAKKNCGKGTAGVYCCLTTTDYGTACEGSNGKTGLYGTDGRCYTCNVDSSTPFKNPINNNCGGGTGGVYCCGTNKNYGSSCTGSDGRTGLYGTNGDCYTCPVDETVVTNPINNNCGNGVAGVYCCASSNNGEYYYWWYSYSY